MELVEDSECLDLTDLNLKYQRPAPMQVVRCLRALVLVPLCVSDRRAQNAEFAVTSSRNRWNLWETTPDIISSISCFIRALSTLSIQSWNVFITGAAKLMERRVRIAASW